MLYKLNQTHDRDTYQKVKRVTLAEIGWKEKDLENLVANNIQDFISSNDLMTIFNERSYQEEPDILALDSQGDLYIFELKRWSGKQENLLQVLRYGQLFGRSTYGDLNGMYQKYQHDPTVDLLDAHATYFFCSGQSTALSPNEFNRKQHFIIVTNGIDQKTLESIMFWKRNGLSIDAIVYLVFEIYGEYFIEFNTYSQFSDHLEYENNSYILNTDYKNSTEHHHAMLREHKAAAYNTGWKEKIQKLQKGDTVFLYHSGVGIIAYGKADGILNKVDEDSKAEYEYNMNLEDFVLLEHPISAAMLKEITNYSFSFRQTLFSISEEAAKKIILSIK